MSKSSHAGRNELCPCGSGKKYKKCCELKQRKTRGATVMMIVVGILMTVGRDRRHHRDHQRSPRRGATWRSLVSRARALPLKLSAWVRKVRGVPLVLC